MSQVATGAFYEVAVHLCTAITWHAMFPMALTVIYCSHIPGSYGAWSLSMGFSGNPHARFLVKVLLGHG